MTSSPGLRGWSRLQARRGVLQTPTDDDDDRHQRPPTICVGGPVISHIASISNTVEYCLQSAIPISMMLSNSTPRYLPTKSDKITHHYHHIIIMVFYLCRTKKFIRRYHFVSKFSTSFAAPFCIKLPVTVVKFLASGTRSTWPRGLWEKLPSPPLTAKR